MIVLETSRFILRQLTLDDLAAVIALYSDPSPCFTKVVFVLLNKQSVTSPALSRNIAPLVIASGLCASPAPPVH